MLEVIIFTLVVLITELICLILMKIFHYIKKTASEVVVLAAVQVVVVAISAITGSITGGIFNGVNGVCFITGTTILTTTGFVLIKDKSIGDIVWSKIFETGGKKT